MMRCGESSGQWGSKRVVMVDEGTVGYEACVEGGFRRVR